MSSKPTPFMLTLCCEGVNQALQFKSRPKAAASMTTVLNAQKADIEGDIAHCFFKIEDDYGGTVTGRGNNVRTMRLVDCTEEHRANMQLEIIKAQAALDFKDLVQQEHPGLMLARAAAPGAGLIRTN